MISAIDPFFGAFAESGVADGVAIGGVERFASDEAGVVRALAEKEAEMGEGFGLEASDSFLEAEAAGRSLEVRAVLNKDGLAEPA